MRSQRQFVRVGQLEGKFVGRRKLTLVHAEQEFDRRGLRLLSENYVNNSTKMRYSCKKCDYEGQKSLKSAKQGCGCFKCAREKTKLGLTYARKEFKKQGLLLLEKEYVDISTKMSYRCGVCNYRGKVHLNQVKNMHCGCPKCAKKLKLTLSHAKKEFAKQGLILLAEEYKNSKDRMCYRCVVCGYNGSKHLNSIQSRGTGCPRCKNTLKRTLPEVKKAFEEQNLELLCTEYTNNKIKLPYRCKKCSYKGSKRLDLVTSGSGCPICAKRPVSKISQEWLDSLGILQEYRELTIKDLNIRADAYDPKTNTVYEFFGDYWHGNLDVYSAEKINLHNKKTFGELYKDTLKRLNLLKSAGYNVIYIWESDFRKLLRSKK